MKITNYKCPFCKSPIVIIGAERIETLCDHVSDPNGNGSIQDIYACSNNECGSNKETIQVRWDGYGDLYTFGCNYSEANTFIKENAINGNNAPFGMMSRRSNVEISKAGVDKRYLEIWPKWYFLNFGLLIEYVYTADLDGNVLTRKTKWQWLKKSGSGATHFTSVFAMMNWSLKQFHRHLQHFIDDTNSNYAARKLLEHYESLPSWDKRAYRRLSKWYIRTFFKKYKILAETKIKDK